MLFRSLLAAAPLALVTSALALSSPVQAFDGSIEDDRLELAPLDLAQATPPAPPPPHASQPSGAGTDRRGDQSTFNPKAVCLDHVARRASNRTYIKVRLELKPEQMTAWNAFAKAADDADAKDIARCNMLPSELKDRPTYIQRLAMEENAMKARIERIEAVKPTLTALYDTLTPEQKVVLDRPRPMGGHMMHRHGQR